MKKTLIILFLALSIVSQGQTFSTLLHDKQKVFNVLDYGAVSDDAVSDVTAINNAIDDAYDMFDYPFGGGTVFIPAGIYAIDDTIRLRANVTIQMERNTVLYVDDDYAGAVLVADPTVTHCNIHGGIIFSSFNLMTGISIVANASGEYMQECSFHDMTIQGCLTGISLYSDNVGFINSNYFDNIWIEDFVNGIVAYEGPTSAGLSGNNFNNTTLQCDDATDYGLKDIDLSYSTFTGLFIWDLSVTATAGITIRNGSRNVFNGGNWSSQGFSDTGQRNRFITGDFISTGSQNTGNVVAGTGITAAMLNPQMVYSGSSAVDISANPQIADGYDGQEITIIGSSDTNTLTLDDGDGLILSGQCVLGVGDAITLTYNKTFDYWIEISRSNN